MLTGTLQSFTIGYVITLFILKDNHLGFPMAILNMDNMVNFLKVSVGQPEADSWRILLTPTNHQATLAIQVMYYCNIFCIKVSIVLTYLRFGENSFTLSVVKSAIFVLTVHAAVSKTFRTLCYATIGIHAVFFVICVAVTLAQCQPLHKMWDFVGAVEGKCINGTAFFYCRSTYPYSTLRATSRS